METKKYTFYNYDGRIEKDITCKEFTEKYKYVVNKVILHLMVTTGDIVYRGWTTKPIISEQQNIPEQEVKDVKSEEGWTNISTLLHSVIPKQVDAKRKDVISEAGVISYGVSQVEFRKMTGCSKNSSSKLFNNKTKTVKGYRIYNKNN